ncbi:ABC transporter substrate-binding protein [Microbaculum marinum]|uniref:ABC transporter substrate-binding protein n=1 Tax=Microbaculum marinum TaxID=1764581 RepID=A0AAW9RE14_9HYPH
MNRHLTAISAALALGLCASAGHAQTETVRFACYIPITGPLAQFGANMQHGFEMALEDFEKSGKLKDATVTIDCEDDQNRADDAINLARKFIEDDSYVASIGSWGSTVTLAAGPLYDKAKMVNITPISSHPDVTKVGPYVFRQSIIQSKEGPANAEYLNKLGVKKLAMIGLPNDYGKANMALTRMAFEKSGGEVVFEEFIRPDAQDFRQVIQKAARTEPDMIYLGLFAPQAALIAKQTRQLGIEIPFYGSAALGTYDFPRLAGEAANGTRLLLVFNPATGDEMADFFKRYEEKYGSKPDAFAANSYITATTLLDIVAEQYPDVTRESIREGLDSQTTIDTIAGPTTYDPQTREWTFRFRDGVIEDGEFKIVE